MTAARKILDETVSAAQANARANLKVYTTQRKSKKLKRKQALKINMMVCAAGLLLMCLVYTSLGAKVTTVGYEINQLKKEINTAENTNARLMLEVEELSSPKKIAAFAQTQMGMVETNESNIIYQDFSGISADDITLASSGSLTTVTPSANATVEVLEEEEGHPVLDALSSLWGNFSKNNKEDANVVAEK